MCCLFGLFDYGRRLSAEQKTQVIRILATAAEARGTDAAGIAYSVGGQLRIVKSPGPAHKARFRVPVGANVVMGHTRMTTQGSAQKNRNNHPFMGKARSQPFALAHNGVLWNDADLRERLNLPATEIETDSYVAVQMIERQGKLDFQSLKSMAELLEGSFTITVLSRNNDLYIVKGDSPFCLYRYPGLGIYLYASTSEILGESLRHIVISGDAPEKIKLNCGAILRIRPDGRMESATFDASNLYGFSYGYWPRRSRRRRMTASAFQQGGADALRMVAGAFGYTPEDIDELLADGFTVEELEDYLYCGEI